MKPNWRDEVKTCACGEKYWPTASISRHNWNLKEFCSTKCPALATMHRKRGEAAAQERSGAQKKCEARGKSFGCPNGVRRHVWLARKYCSQACSAKGRRMKSDEWRATVTKVFWVCNQVFRPLPGVRWQAWIRKDICDRFCGAAACLGRRVVVADPLDQVQPHQRLKWLRLSSSKCGKKVPWSIEVMGEGCAVTGSALWKIECGGGVTGGWIEAAAKRLGVPADLFTCSVEKFAKVVNDAGLTAKLSVSREEGRAA